MKKLILASLAVAAMLASCEKTSEVDSTLTANQGISYSPYAGASTTKGSAVNSNSDFCGDEDSYGSFKVLAHDGSDIYYGFDQITYDGTDWAGTTTRYWPVDASTLYFGAYYPAGATFKTAPTYVYSGEAHSLSFGYTVGSTVTDQQDIMYAITEHTPTVVTDDVVVGLHFKHALTQIGFTATKDADIKVTVTSLKVCNIVDNGTFTAAAVTDDSNAVDNTTPSDDVVVTTGIWSNATPSAQNADGNVTTNLQHYAATMASESIEVPTSGSDAAQLTSTTDVMMLLPQTLTKWDPTGTTYTSSTTAGIAYGTDSYLAIGCVITDASDSEIVNGTIYVPFGEDNIAYAADDSSAEWRAGYKITYNLHFGGGYTIPGGDDDDEEDDKEEPEPGEVPDPDDIVKTLRSISYTVSVDEWKVVAESTSVTL